MTPLGDTVEESVRRAAAERAAAAREGDGRRTPSRSAPALRSGVAIIDRLAFCDSPKATVARPAPASSTRPSRPGDAAGTIGELTNGRGCGTSVDRSGTGRRDGASERA
jgi:hypothetical protein